MQAALIINCVNGLICAERPFDGWALPGAKRTSQLSWVREYFRAVRTTGRFSARGIWTWIASYVAVEGDGIAGYATVAPGHIEIENLPAARRKGLPHKPPGV
jgi:hypothetical protein